MRPLGLFDSLHVRVTLIALVAALPALVVIVGDALRSRDLRIEEAVQAVVRDRDVLVADHDTLLKSTRQLLGALARLPAVRDHDGAEASRLLAALKQEHPVYQNLFADRPDGTVFASAVPLARPVVSADTAWFRRAAAGAGFVVGEYLSGRITGAPVLTLAQGVRDASGELLAVVGASLPTDWLAERLRAVGAGRTTHALLVTGDRVLAHYGPSGEIEPEALARLVAQAVVRATTTGVLRHGMDGPWPLLLAWASLHSTADGAPVYLAVVAPVADEVNASSLHLQRQLVRFGALGLILVGAVMLAGRLLIGRPLERLLAATRRVSRGELVPAGIDAGAVELVELGQHFDAMVHALAERRAEVERHQAELETLARENEQGRLLAERDLHALMSRVQDVIFRLDAAGTLVWITPSVTTLTGYLPEELIGQCVCVCLADPTDKDRMLQALDAGGGSVRDFEVRLRHRDGTQSYGSINAQRTDSGVEGVMRDISEQVRAREQLLSFNRMLEQRVRERTVELERSNHELEAFTYSVSHDLRAPLRGVEGFSKVLLDRFADDLPEQAQGYLHRVRNAGLQMARLIDDLLSLSRINRYALRWQRVDLSAMARAIAEELRAGDGDRAVTFDIAPDLVVDGDERLLQVALRNLLENAWKYSSRVDHARIAVAAECRDGIDFVAVRDNGVGFDMRYADKLFTPFQRLHSAREFEGTGIGLATVMRVIQRHGGTIHAESEPGLGSTFRFRLGSAAPDATAHRDPQAQEV